MSDKRFDATMTVVTNAQALSERADNVLSKLAEIVVVIEQAPAPEEYKTESTAFYTEVATLLATYQVVTRELVETTLSSLDTLEKMSEAINRIRDENTPYDET